MKILAWLLPLLVAALLSSGSLRKGQVIKQFEAYSIAESLARDPIGVMRTTIPCDGGIPWTLEPPVFHELGALAIAVAPGWTALAPLLAYLLLICGIWKLSGHLIEERDPRRREQERAAVTVLVALAPAFARFSIQFVPDVLACALMAWSAAFLLEGKRKTAVAGMAVATLTKALVFVGVPFLIAWEGWRALEREARSERSRTGTGTALGAEAVRVWVRLWAWVMGCALIVVVPFLGWTMAVKVLSSGNAIHSQGMLRSYALEGWGLLLDPAYYARFLTWIWVKGTGIPLGSLAIVALYRMARRRPASPAASMLAVWSLALLPYWIFIRQGNRVHDYYSLSLILPLALLGARELGRAAIAAHWKIAIALASVALGVQSLAGMSEVPLADGQSRPVFCGSEIRKIEPRAATGG